MIYKSMKKCFFLVLFFVLFLGVETVFAFDIPEKPQNFVNDYANVLSLEDKNVLETKISNFEKQTTNEIAVVLISSLDGDTIENIAQNIFTKWEIGKKDKNNGVLMLFAMNDRKSRIHTGYGIEGDLTDLATSYLQSDVIAPAFQGGNYYVGINNALDKIIESLKGNNIVPEDYSSSTKNSKISFGFVVFGFVVLQWIIAILARSKSWWFGGILGAVIGGAIWIFASLSTVFSIFEFIIFILLGLGLDYFVSKTYQKTKSAGGHFPWWIGGGGFGGHSGGSGGFGGFGGGFSGGGGSSGSW